MDQARREGLETGAYFKELEAFFAELKADEFSRSDGDAEEIRWLTAEWQRLDLNNKDHKDDILHEEKNPPPPGFAWVPKKVLRKNLIAKLRADGLLKEDEDEDPTAAGTPS